MKLAIAVIAIAVACGGCGAKKQAAEESDAAQPVQVAKAERGEITRVVEADAVLFPVTQAAVTPKVSAPVKQFYVNRGDRVSAGQLLAVLENRDLAAAASESKALYEQAQAQYKTTTQATLPDDATKARADVESARGALDAAKKLYENRVALVKEGALAQKLADDAKVSLVQAQSAFDTAQRHLETMNQVGRTSQAKAAEEQMAAAKAHYASAAAQVGYTEVRSPIAGTVADRPVSPGEMASSGTALITVVDTRQIVARANVAAAEIGHIRVGQKAAILAGDIKREGTVSVVSPSTDPSTTTIEVWVRAENRDGSLKPGVAARVQIDAGAVTDAVIVPSSAVLSSDEGGDEVFVVDAKSVAHETKVQTGVRNGDQVQIASGLNGGENVITEGGLGLADKAKVEVEKPGAASGEAQGGKDADDK